MMFKGKSIFNASFDVFADNYHSVRPGYPEVLFTDIKDHCGISDDSQVLEIGAGSGIATTELAKLGCRVIAIEPGKHLASIARKQTQTLKKVKVFEGTFENFQSDEKFDAILAFTAFHWLSEGDKYQQIASLLQDSGSLVVVWNSFFQSDDPVSSEVNQAYKKFLPDVYPESITPAQVNDGVLLKLNQRERELVSNPLFLVSFLRKYVTIYNYDDQTYPKLLNTFPKVVGVEDEKRHQFLENISDIVKRHRKISVPVLTTIVICRRRLSFLKALTNP